MSVKYRVREHINPSNPQAPKKYYPSIVSSGRCDQRRLAELIAAMSTYSSADTLGMLEALLTVIPDELAKGNVVELGEFGSFWLKVNADGAETEEEVRPTQIRRQVDAAFQAWQGFQERLEVHRVQKVLTFSPSRQVFPTKRSRLLGQQDRISRPTSLDIFPNRPRTIPKPSLDG